MGRRSTALFVVAAAADVLLAATGRQAARRLTKPLLTPALMAGRDRATQVALGLGGAGDVALLGSGDGAFTAGLGTFLAGHVAWIVALRRRDPGGRLRDRRAAAVAEVAAYAALNTALWRRTGPHRVPVVVYSTALLAMALTALDSRSPRVAAGGALFLVSDAVLALDRFAGVRPPAAEAVVMSTYAAAQGLLAGPADRGRPRPTGPVTCGGRRRGPGRPTATCR